LRIVMVEEVTQKEAGPAGDHHHAHSYDCRLPTSSKIIHNKTTNKPQSRAPTN
jgi:hypothetical protein